MATRRELELAICLLWSTMLLGCTGGADLSSSKVTVGNIRLVAPGMTEVEVQNILGSPFAVEQESDKATHRRMDYTRPTYRGWYPMLWVHLDTGRVVSVVGKQYGLWGLDDVPVYLSTAEHRWESGAFEQTFPK